MVDWWQALDRFWFCVSICACGSSNTLTVVANEELNWRFSFIVGSEKLNGRFKEAV